MSNTAVSDALNKLTGGNSSIPLIIIFGGLLLIVIGLLIVWLRKEEAKMRNQKKDPNRNLGK